MTRPAPAAAEAVIRITGLGFAYGSEPLFQGLGLEVGAGRIYGLVGADGAGKSTLLRIAVGQLTPASGQVRVLGVAAGSPALRARVAYMPQGFGLYPDLSVDENLAFFADLHGLACPRVAARIRDLLERTGLRSFGDRPAGRLSGGMMQKLALACALISEPRAMFLDEPTTGVDPVSRRAFWQLLNRVRAEGVAVLYATANLDEAERCDRVGLLEAGRILREGTPRELARVPGRLQLRVSGPGVRRLLARLRRLPGVELAFARGRTAVLWLRAETDPGLLRQQVQAIDRRLELLEVRPSLQETMLRERALRERADG